MQHLITAVTAAEGLGHVYQNRLFEIAEGPYAGRLLAVIQIAPHDIALTWSDNRGRTWTAPQTVITDAADNTCDCVMDDHHHLQIVYTQQTTFHLVTRRLTFSGGLWTAGSTVTVYDGGPSYDPSLALDPDGVCWVTWSLYTTPHRTIHLKTSADSGATWGHGPSDYGVALSSPATFIWSRLLIGHHAVHVFYVDYASGVYVRSLLFGAELWDSAVALATGHGFSRHFDAALGLDGRLGVVYDHNGLYFREFDGDLWSVAATLDTVTVTAPQLLYKDNIPVVVYLRPFAGTELVAMYTDRSQGAFAASRAMDARAKPFDSVLLFHAATGSYQDRTDEAASTQAADVTHPQSGCLLKDAGDAVFLGMAVPFRFARCNLSTPGSGGTISCSYWNGEHWLGFTPAGGLNHLDGSWADLLFWPDYDHLPLDWQKRDLNGHQRYWLRLVCASAYDTGPVADQVSAVSRLGRILIRR